MRHQGSCESREPWVTPVGSARRSSPGCALCRPGDGDRDVHLLAAGDSCVLTQHASHSITQVITLHTVVGYCRCVIGGLGCVAWRMIVVQGKVPYDALALDARARIEKYRTIRWFLTPLSLAPVIAATYLPAHELAGHRTGVSVTVTISAAISLVMSAGAVAAWGNWQKRRAGALDAKNADLVERVESLQEENKELKTRLSLGSIDVRDASGVARKGRSKGDSK